jgi:hypothetical protein
MALYGQGRVPEAPRMQAELLRILAAARAVPLASYEDETRESIAAGLAPRVLEVAEDAVRSLTELMETYEPSETSDFAESARQRSFLHLIDDLMTEVAARERVADLAFLGRIELRRKAQALRALALDGGDAWQLIAAAGSTLRCLRKAVTAVEASLCACEGLEPRLGFAGEILSSLAARRAFAEFRFEIRRLATLELAVDLLRGAAVSLVRLVDHEVYESLRVEDRMQIRGLQRRILVWHGGARDLASGHQIWVDLAGFSELTAGIRNRQELVRHDGDLAEELLGRLRRGEEVGPARLRDLLGRNDELDELLLSGRELGVEEIRELLQRIVSEARGAGTVLSLDADL